MGRNYYVVLGVAPDAAPGVIRSAYRRLARRFHPDRGEAADPRTFREVAEAYGVLSDPDRRARYDRRLRTGPRKLRVAFGRPAAPAPEPLISEPMPVAGPGDGVRPSLDGLIQRFARNGPGLVPVPKAERPEPLHFELILSPQEAERGVRIPFRIPVFAPCPLCDGTGRDWVFPCDGCAGEGRLVHEAPLEVEVPRGVRDRSCFDVSLERLGVRNLWLRIHVRVDRP